MVYFLIVCFVECLKIVLVNVFLLNGVKIKEMILVDIKKIFGMDEEDSEGEVYWINGFLYYNGSEVVLVLLL